MTVATSLAIAVGKGAKMKRMQHADQEKVISRNDGHRKVPWIHSHELSRIAQPQALFGGSRVTLRIKKSGFLIAQDILNTSTK